MKIPFTVDTHIRIEKSLLPRDFIEDLEEYLFVTVPLYGGDTNDFYFFSEEDGKIVMPRGFLNSFEKGLLRSSLSPSKTDLTVSNEVGHNYTSIALRDHQEPAVRAMLSSKTGIYQAPPGSGKTATALEAIRRSNERAIVLVDKTSIASQWVERAQQFLNTEAALIGDTHFEVGNLTIATRQTLWSRREKLREEGFFKQWGFVVVDEVHHSQSNSYQLVIQEFSPKYLIGLSATPHKVPGMEKVIEFMMGKVIHKTEEEALQGKNILMKPEVRIKYTKFDAEYKTWSYGGRQMNNYQSIIKKLVSDKDRNLQIASDLCQHHERKILVVTKRLGHIETLKNLALEKGYPNEIFSLTGKESEEERQNIKDSLLKLDGFILFSTIADEALDIPSLDTILLVFPAKNKGLIQQQIGRVERFAPGKPTPIIIDYVDTNCGVLKNQAYERNSVYLEKGLQISRLV